MKRKMPEPPAWNQGTTVISFEISVHHLYEGTDNYRSVTLRPTGRWASSKPEVDLLVNQELFDSLRVGQKATVFVQFERGKVIEATTRLREVGT